MTRPPACTTCDGRGAISTSDYLAACDACGGTGKHGFMPSPHSGVIDSRALRAVERARSPRTGRLVAASTALAEYRTSLDSVPVREEAMHGGFWDYEQESLEGPRRGPPRPERYDAEAMAEYAEKHSARMNGGELDVYALFWLRRMSYKQVADSVGSTREQVYQVIKRLRVKLHGSKHG